MAETTPVVPQSKEGDQTDPSALATQALWREVAHLKELLLTKISSIERAQQVYHEDLVRVPTETMKAVLGLRELQDQKFNTILEKFGTVNEKFHGIDVQFAERDIRVVQSAATQTTAVNAALQAQKEAAGEQAKSFALSVDKSERSTLDLINQQRLLAQTNYGALNDKVVAIDTRMTRIESLGLGMATAKTDQRSETRDKTQNNQWLIGLIIGTLIALVGIAIGIATRG